MVKPFRFINAPLTLEKIAGSLFKDLNNIRVYVEAVVISSSSIEEHTNHLTVVCNRIKEIPRKTKINKCVFEVPQVEMSWYFVSERGVESDPEKVK